jgi:lipopolysaccharide transport system permease protein
VVTGALSIWKPWRWIHRLPDVIASETAAIARDFRLSWRVLWALTLIESRRKYAGSILGMLWYPLYSALLLGSYCFVYLIVLQIRYKEFGGYGYTLFIFAGLIPFLGFSEAISTSTPSVKQSAAILRNAVFPIEFVPIKFVCAALLGLLSSLVILLAMVLPTSYFGWHWLYLPVAIVGLMAFCVTIAWALSAVAVIVPDIAQLVTIALMLLMFISPVGYSIDMVPPRVRPLLYLNPLTYLVETFRFAVLGIRTLPIWTDFVFIALCVIGAALSGTFFRRLSPMFSDYE